MKKLKEVTLEINIDASKDETWDLLFNRFGEVNIFNPVIDGSHHTKGTQGQVGCERFCQIDDKHSVHERIIAARDNNSFDVEIIEGGLPMMDKMMATIDVKSINADKTKVFFTMKYNTNPAFMAIIMKGMMRKMLMKMMIGLKYHLETGKTVTKENFKSILREHRQLETDGAFQGKLKVA